MSNNLGYDSAAAQPGGAGFAHSGGNWTVYSPSYTAYDSNQLPGRKMTEFPDAAGTIMAIEYESIDGNNNANLYGNMNGSTADLNEKIGSAKPNVHFDGDNYLFVDGHVKFLRYQQTLGAGTTDAPRGMWTLIEGD